MLIRTYTDWVEMMAKDLSPDEKICCPDCKGYCEVECDQCGHESDCETCDRKGEVLASDVSEKEIRESLTKGQYADALEKDLTDLNAYQGGDDIDRIAVLANHGFSIWDDIKSKNEVIRLNA